MTEFNTQVCPKENVYRLQFETDNREHFEKVQTAARYCLDEKWNRQIDRLRTMNAEELADWIVRMQIAVRKDEASLYTRNLDISPAPGAKEIIIDWLLSEVK